MKKESKSQGYNLKIEPSKLVKIKKLNIDLADALRAHIDQLIDHKECPACKRKL